jgi:hypothetical protein
MRRILRQLFFWSLMAKPLGHRADPDAGADRLEGPLPVRVVRLVAAIASLRAATCQPLAVSCRAHSNHMCANKCTLAAINFVTCNIVHIAYL